MLASNNVLFPANGEPSIVPSQDIVLGLYYTTRERVNGKGEGLFFMDVAEVQRAYDNREVELHSRVTVRLNEYEKDADGEWQPVLRRFETTVGRALLSEILPQGLPFSVLNRLLKKKEISRLINQRSEEHQSELQSLMRTSYAVFCLKKKILTHSKSYRLTT